MWAVDGALLRLRIAEARIHGDQLTRLAAITERFATNGVLLTRRAKFELRGVTEVDNVLAALDAAGWLETEAMAGLPDIVVSPDPRGQAGAMARAIRASLIDAGVPRLPDKFLIAVDAGGAAALPALFADIRLDAINQRSWRLGLARQRHETISLGRFTGAALPDVVARLLAAFARYRPNADQRMRDLPASARQRLVDEFRQLASVADPVLLASQPAALGYHPALGHVLGFVFGHLSPAALRALATVAGPAGIGLRSDRRIIVDRLTATQRQRLVADGAIVDRGDPRAEIAACVGQPGCSHASTDTRADALSIAERWPDLARRGLHVSGCSKGCAHRHAALATLTGCDGDYNVIINGAPDDMPRWRGLDIETAAACLVAHGND